MGRVGSQFLRPVVELWFVMVLLAMVATAFAGFASAAPKAGTATIGGPAVGTAGGSFNTPRGVAVNQTGAGGVAAGTLYVADSINHRIQRIDPDRSFHSLWGQDVDQTTVGTGFEVCTAASGDVCKAGITTAQTGGAMSNPQAVAVDQADGSVYVADLGNRRVQKFTADGTFVWAAGWDVVSAGLGNDATGTPNQFETCVAANSDVCKVAAAAGANAGQFAANVPAVAVNPATGQVLVADATNRRIHMLSSSGAFVSTVGYDVVPAGQAGDTGVALETCPAGAAQVTGGCQAGQTTNGGNNPGQFSNLQPSSLATDSGGAIYAVEASGNNRVQRLTATGSGAAVVAPAQVSGTPAPTRVAVDQVSDRLYVAKGTNPGIVLEFDGAGGFVETHAATAGLPAALGLAVRSATGDIYYPTQASHRIVVLGAPVAPVVSLDDITTFGDTTATLSGSVDPTGLATSYRFEYRRDDLAEFASVPVPDADAGPIGSSNAFSHDLAGLEPNRLYHVRLVATKSLGGGTATSPEKTFTTDPAVPDVTGVAAYDLGDASARLTGLLDSNSQAASYVFEYGTTSGLGSSTPVTDVGDGPDPVAVSQLLSGLEPDTSYYYRLVATNGTGATPSAVKTFRTRAVPKSPGIRVYEQVSPVDKKNGFTFGATLRPDGERASFCNAAGFGEPPGQISYLCAAYISRRTDDGWVTTAPGVPACKGGRYTPALASSAASPDLTKVFFQTREEASCAIPPLVPSAPLESDNVYTMEAFGNPGFTLLSPLVRQTVVGGTFVDSTADFSHVVYLSVGDQTPDTSNALSKVYEWHAGEVSLVSRDTSNVPFATDSRGVSPVESVNGVSESGNRIFFTNGSDAAQKLYVRKDATSTVEVSQSECASACGPAAAANFEWATADGSKALLTSEQKLTDSDTSVQTTGTATTTSGSNQLTNVVTATGTGTLTAGSAQVAGVSETAGEFLVGQGISGTGIPAGAKIADKGAGTLTLSVEATASGAQSLSAGGLPFRVGQFVAGAGIPVPASTTPATITAVEGQTITLSLSATASGSGVAIAAPVESDLFRFTDSANPSADQNLALLSQDHEPSDGTTAGVLGVSGISDDGDTVFFVATGQVVAGGPTAPGPKVYRWRWNGGDSAVEYLATLDRAALDGFLPVLGHDDQYAWRRPGPRNANSSRRPEDRIVAGDGDRMILQTTTRLLDGADRDSDLDVYRWDEQDGWACVSCQAPGAPSAGESTLEGARPGDEGLGMGRVVRQRNVMADGGERVFFVSNDPLVAGDVNGDRRDVYEWDDGVLRLVSSGAGVSDGSPVDNQLVGVGESGRDVFFLTSDRLVGWDTDDSTDLYDARVGGGFPEPPEPVPPCDLGGDACQGGGSAPISRTFGSGGGSGANAVPAPRGVVRFSALTRAQRVALAYGTPVRLGVRVNRPGRLRVVGRARIANRSRRVLAASRKVSKPGSVGLVLRLSRPARRQLSRTGQLKVRMVLRFSSARGTLSRTLVLRRAPTPAGSRARRATATTILRER